MQSGSRSGSLALPSAPTNKFTQFCLWTIDVEHGKRISLETRVLDLGKRLMHHLFEYHRVRSSGRSIISYSVMNRINYI